MLEPQNRRLLLDCVQPPEGYALDQAIGATYSLDLYALLGVPVAAAFRDAMSEDGQADPLATLEALRRYADRIHLFCQAGEIHVPRGQQRLFAYLEDCVIPVVPTSEHGVFHPKCWLLRFVDSDDGVLYRFVCLSRNLTFDRSWDTALVLDGSLEAKGVRDPDPRPLRRFLEALPGLAVRESETARAAVNRMLGELDRVRFECPPEVESLRFWPMGVRGTKPPEFVPEYRPLLVVSPFLSEGWLARHVDGRRVAKLVSREDQLHGLSEETCGLFDDLYTFSQNATPEEDVEAQGEDDILLSGLHAKLFVLDDGWRARVWTGSANATEAAFRHNVEFLVELDGWKKNLGIKALLAEGDGEAGFRDLLEYWERPTEELEETDAAGQRLDDRLWQARRALANADLRVSIEPTDQEPPYVFRVEGDWPELGQGLIGQAWPIGLEERQARAIDGGTLDFGAVTLEALTAFVAIELTAREQDESRKSRFVLRLPVDGLPADRGSRLLRSMLQDRQEFMRLLMILLADDGIEAIMNAGIGQGAWSGEFRVEGAGDTPLLESLLKSLDRSPERLDQIKRLLDDIGDSDELGEMLPEGFLEVWEAVWANRANALDGGDVLTTDPESSGSGHGVHAIPITASDVARLEQLLQRAEAETHAATIDATPGLMPAMTYPQAVEDLFRRELARAPWMRWDYDPAMDAKALQTPGDIHQANFESLARMLTAAQRGERFCDGWWRTVLEQQLLWPIVHQLRELVGNDRAV